MTDAPGRRSIRFNAVLDTHAVLLYGPLSFSAQQPAAEDGGVSVTFCATSAAILHRESAAHAGATARASPPRRPETPMTFTHKPTEAPDVRLHSFASARLVNACRTLQTRYAAAADECCSRTRSVSGSLSGVSLRSPTTATNSARCACGSAGAGNSVIPEQSNTAPPEEAQARPRRRRSSSYSRCRRGVKRPTGAIDTTPQQGSGPLTRARCDTRYLIR
jgi:hypothetical protein